MSDLARLSVRVTSDGISNTSRELEKLGRTANTTERQTDSLGRTATATGGAFVRFASVIAAAGIGLAATQIANYTDRMAKMRGQLTLVTSGQEEMNAVYQRALTLANATGQSLEATVGLYAKLSRSTQDLGLSQDQLFTITQAINQAFVVSGATATEAAAAMHQLSQGLASGTLRGEELNSVMENSPRLARALADGLGVSIGQLRAMGAEGELTAEKVTGALQLMASEIDAEFQQMPMTIGRASQEIKNNLLDAFGSADAGPAIESIQKLNEALADPQMKRNLSDLASLFVEAAAGAFQLALKLDDLVGWLTKVSGTTWIVDLVLPPSLSDMIDMARGLGLFTDELDRMSEAVTGSNIATLKSEIDALSASIDKMESGGRVRGGGSRIAAAKADLEALQTQLKQAEAAAKAYATGTTAAAAAQDKLSAIVVTAKERTLKLTDAQKAAVRQQEASRRALEAQRDALGDFIKDMEFEVAISRESEREQAILTAQRRFATVATDESADAIRRLVGTLYDQQEAARAAGEAQRAAADAAQQAAEDSARAADEAMQPWRDALQGMAEDVDRGFTQAWRDAFNRSEDGFKNFASNIWDAFLGLWANMAHLAITRPITMQISAAMGGLVPGGAMASAVPGGVTPSSMLSGLTNGITSAGAGLYSAIGTLTNDLGLFKTSNAFNAKAAATTGWTMAGDALGGFAGKFAADKAFGETSGIGAMAGGIAGSALIPIPGLGAAIGSFIGAGLEKAASKLFGQKNDGNNRGYANFDLATGGVQSGGYGKSFSPENVTAAERAVQELQAFADAIGGSSLKANITMGGKEGIKYGNVAYGTDQDAFLQAAFKDVAAASTNVSDKIKPLIAGFSGTAEELKQFATGLIALDTEVGGISDNLLYLIQNARGSSAEIVQFSQAIISISQQAGINTVTNAIRDFTTVAPSAAVAYRDHTAELYRQINAYDGSAASAANLNNLLLENKAAAYEYAMGLQTIGRQFGLLSGNQAKDIRQSVLTADQLRTQRTQERDYLRYALDFMQDPQQAEKAGRAILELNKQIWDSLDAGQKTTSRAEEFAGIAESTNATLQGLVSDTLTGLQATQQDINAATFAMLDSSADKFKEAADTSLDAAAMNADSADKMGAFINQLITGVRVGADGSLEAVS